MKPRKSKEIKKVLLDKGFIINPDKTHHAFFYLYVNGKKHNIYTYFSHNMGEYGHNLMGQIKKQLKFTDTSQAEDFFDCPMSGKDYIEMLKNNGSIK